MLLHYIPPIERLRSHLCVYVELLSACVIAQLRACARARVIVSVRRHRLNYVIVRAVPYTVTSERAFKGITFLLVF